jgi:N utilization substance protein B
LKTGSSRPERTSLSLRDRIDLHRARAWALHVHYRWECAGIRDNTLEEALAETRRSRAIAPRRLPFVERLIGTLAPHCDAIDRALVEHLQNWRLNRLSAVDRGILRLAATELLYFHDVPPKVVIQEAVRLAEAYGGDESPRFVNGVLDALYRRDRDLS